MTLNEIIRLFREAGIENAPYEARLLASVFTGWSAARLMTAGNEEVTAVSQELESAVYRRAKREPLQYIVGEWPFMGLSFAVSPACLIPRPDTETLCEAALGCLPPSARVADLCTGSGCIGISLAHHRPDITVVAVDIDDSAAACARENASRLGVADRVSVRLGDVTVPVFASEEIFDCIVANPPYIALDEMETLEPELSYEPRHALTDEGDGLSVIRGVLLNAARSLTDSGALFIEFGASQGAAVLTMAEEFGFTGEILRDLGGKDRVLKAHRTSFIQNSR